MFSVKFNSFEAAYNASKIWTNKGYYSILTQIDSKTWGLTLRSYNLK
jgi:hypothetical protein